ncbi:glycoside hydrolase [Opitutaceae bacterium EW11]|nr:glycoside hydrolase [Opitutaceae bacterium EW11]
MTSPFAPPAPASAKAAVSAPWIPDTGDGGYRNPVLYADYSDPDAIRVGDDYWLVSSSFGHVPGLPILHSRDLVNWTLVNHALPRLVPDDHFSTPRHGQGVWAPSLRHHQGRYWIFYPDPDFGLYAITADDPRSRWSDPVLIKAGKGLIDPCPLWDEDGTGYLVHGWAKSRSGVKNRVTLHRLRPDSFGVADVGTVVIDGDRMDGWNTIEGPKLYRRGNYYYIFSPAGGVTHGYQAVFRSKNVFGPYEHRIVLAQGSTPVNGPHQGAWVDSPDGRHWFLHFQELPAYGRVVHLQPVEWKDDWPSMGAPTFDGGPGVPVLVGRGPSPAAVKTVPATSDEFDGGALGLQWQWQCNPSPEWVALGSVASCLRLRCVPRPDNETLWKAGNLLMQKFPAPEFEVTTSVDATALGDGERCGLVVFGYSYASLSLRRVSGKLDVVLHRCDDAHQSGVERLVASSPANSSRALLRVTVASGGECRFAFSFDGTAFVALGMPFQARSSYWVGAKVGLFALGPMNGQQRGHADFDWFRVSALPSP